MKKTITRIGVMSAALLTLAISANAQWTETATSVYLTNGTKPVGIGTNAPGYPLDIKQQGNCNFRVQSITSGSSNLILARSAAAGTNCLVNYKTGTTALWYTGVAGTNTDFRIRNGVGTDNVFISQASGYMGVGTTTPAARLSLASYSLGGSGTTGSFQIGESNDYNLVCDNNEVYARYNGGSSTLFLQYWAGDIYACAAGGPATFGGPIYGYSTLSASGAATLGSTLAVTGAATLGSSLTVAGYCGIGTTTPAYLLDVQGNTSGSSYHNVNSVVNYVGSSDLRAYYGYSAPADGYGYGGDFTGGYKGIVAYCANGGYGYGVGVTGSSYGTTGTQYGVYGYASGGTTNWAVYAAGNTYSTGGYSSSDAKLKKDVAPITNAMEKINQLQPRTYTFKTDEYKYMGLPTEQQYGFIAQELEQVFPEMVKEVQQPIDNDYKKNGMLSFKAINYTEMIPVLTQAIQEQQKQIESQKAEIETLKSIVNSCCESSAASKVGATEMSSTMLYQNSPNPFNQTTVIRYALSSEEKSGRIIIRDLNGNLVKQVTIAQSGKGQVTINANELSQGTYTYTLEIGGTSVDTKLMVVTK